MRLCAKRGKNDSQGGPITWASNYYPISAGRLTGKPHLTTSCSDRSHLAASDSGASSSIMLQQAQALHSVINADTQTQLEIMLWPFLSLGWPQPEFHFMGLTISSYGVNNFTLWGSQFQLMVQTTRRVRCAIRRLFPCSALKELPAHIAHKLTFDVPKR